MAKTPPKKDTPKRPVRAAKAAAAKAAGYGGGAMGIGAQKAATKQYGLVKNAEGDWVKPDMGFLQRQMTANGWYGTIPGSQTARNPEGVTQAGTTPVNIGGMKFMVGPDGVIPTGEWAEGNKQGVKAGTSFLKGKGKGGGKGGGRTPKHQGPLGSGFGGAETSPPPFGGPDAEAYSPYAEADTTTTNMTRAQGKAYGRGTGTGLYGQTEAPPAETSSVTGETGEGGSGKPGKNRKRAKRLTHKAKTNKSPGGKRVTPKERARIQKAKGK